MNAQEFSVAIASIPFGKELPTARYVFAPDETVLTGPLPEFITKLRQRLGLTDAFNVLKLSGPDYAISFLRYPGFLTDAHPALAEAIRIQLATGVVKRIDFSTHSNPPILHRK